MRRYFLFFLVSFFLLDACENKTERQELLVKRHCGSCHLVPEPGLLDKKSWELGVLPEMVFRMGLKTHDFKLSIPPGDSSSVYSSLPGKPMVTEEEWEAIRDYFLENAPDSLARIEPGSDTVLTLFGITPYHIPQEAAPFISLFRIDTLRNRIFAGTLSSALYQFDRSFGEVRPLHLNSPPSHLQMDNDGSVEISLLGILEPNEQSKGQIVKIEPDGNSTLIIDSLQRPVYFEKVDLNNDKLEDYVICAFGNYTGAVLVCENLGKGKFKKHVIHGSPGARKAIVKDVNKDGLLDILVLMTQGNEQILLLTNQGQFNFTSTSLLRFPSVYGSSYFELIDFNTDGHFDILYTNGDNGDFSDILKPYHGIRIFQNDGNNHFRETWFYPMYGASKAVARDFDQDGDLDIAAISFFPDFERHPERGFLYFENVNNHYSPRTIKMSDAGRWLVMDAADIDLDGDCDLVLGAFDYDYHVPPALVNRWLDQRVSLLILRNTISKADAKPIGAK